MIPCMQMKALRTRLVVSYNLVPYMTYVTRSTRYLRERTLLFPRYLDIYRYNIVRVKWIYFDLLYYMNLLNY